MMRECHEESDCMCIWWSVDQPWPIPVLSPIIFSDKLILILIIFHVNFLIIISNSAMFFSFGLDTQANLEDQDCSELSFKAHQFPKTTVSSPDSSKSGCSFELHLSQNLDSSFEEGTQTNHAQNVWSASVEYLSRTKTNMSSEEGFNGQAPNHPKAPTLEQALKNNRQLRWSQRAKFMEEMQNETEVCGLLTELMVLFHANIFAEVVFMVQYLWEHQYLPYRTRQQSRKTSFLPQFSCFSGFSGQEFFGAGVDYNNASPEEVREEARKGIEQLANQLFTSRRLRYFNLRDIKGTKHGVEAKQEFEVFLTKLSEALFLSAEGVYETEPVVGMFESEEDEMVESRSFARSHSQICGEQDDEGLEWATGAGKRRKLDCYL